ncbi:MAG: hypothetical protein ABEI80_10040 [Haloplanus sp.]
MSDESPPFSFTVARTASRGFEAKDTHLKDLQLTPTDLARLSDVDEGDFLKLVAVHDDISLQAFGRVEARTEATHAESLEDGHIGVGALKRSGLSVTPGDTVTVTSAELPTEAWRRRAFDRVLGVRPATCRIRKATGADTGHKVCRLPPAIKQVVGIEWGDRVILRSADGRVTGVKALPLTDRQDDRLAERRDDHTDVFYPRFREVPIGKTETVPDTLPPIYLSSSARRAMGLTEYGHDGVYQPVKVYRDTRDVFLRLFDSLTIPFLVAAVGIVAGFEIGTRAKLALLIGAFLLVVWSAIFRSRRILLE